MSSAALADGMPQEFGRQPNSFASNEQAFAALYDVDRSIANFDAAYYGAMLRPVRAAYLKHTDWVNRHNSLFLRSALPEPRDAALNRSRAAVAELIGCTVA